METGRYKEMKKKPKIKPGKDGYKEATKNKERCRHEIRRKGRR
jgi:hypothetical protein